MADKTLSDLQGPLRSGGADENLRNEPTKSAHTEICNGRIDTRAGGTDCAQSQGASVETHDGASRHAGPPSPTLLKAAIRNVAGLLSRTECHLATGATTIRSDKALSQSSSSLPFDDRRR